MFMFRADGNPEIGAGHIMRCLSIADATVGVGKRVRAVPAVDAEGRAQAAAVSSAEERAQAGAVSVPSIFVTADENFSSIITGRGHEVAVLDTDYSDMEEELEAGQFQNLIRKCRPTALIVDSYYVTYRYLLALKKLCNEMECCLVYIDDVLAFPYPVDCLINYNIYGPDKKKEYERMYLEAMGTSSGSCPRFLLGPDFAPLRAEFGNLPDRIVNRQAKNIFISTGGGDCEHFSMRMAEEIIKKGLFVRFRFHLIIGAMNEDFPIIREMTDGIPNIMLYHNVTNIQEIMSSCDVAVSAAGSTLYELCATQTPVITYILADNQIPGAEGFERHGVLKCAGDIRKSGAEKLAADVMEAAVRMADDYEERLRVSSAQKRIVDGNGAERIGLWLKDQITFNKE